MTKLIVIPALLKAHIDSYTRKDGTFVQAHDDKRQAAQQTAPQPRVSSGKIDALTSTHAPKMVRKGSEWDHVGRKGKIPAAHTAGFPEFSHKEVYGHDEKTSPAGTDFSPEFAKKGHQGFILKHPNGKRSFVDTQGSNYARYHAPVEDAAAPTPIPSHVQKMVSDVAQSSAKPEHKQAAIDAIMSQHAAPGGDATKPRVVMRKDAAPAGSMTPDAVKDHAMKAGAKFKSGVAVFSKPESAHSFARQAAGSKGGAFVMKHPDHSHHVVVNGADAQRMEKNGYQHAANQAKTGSAAPAKMTNVGSEKWPLHAKTSEKLPAKHEDGSTHHVGGFKPPEYPAGGGATDGYPAGGGATDGDVTVQHEGKTYSFTGKKGKNLKTGETSYEFSHSGDGVERRAWVSKSGHLQED